MDLDLEPGGPKHRLRIRNTASKSKYISNAI